MFLIPTPSPVPAGSTRADPAVTATCLGSGPGRSFSVLGLRFSAFRFPAAFLLCLLLSVSGCSVRHYALRQAGTALAGTGTTFAADDDPEFVKFAVPFGLKLMEGVLAEAPDHQPLRRAAASGFAQYSFAFIQMDADELEEKDFAGAEALRVRARRMYLRARNYGLGGFEALHPGFTNRLASAPREAVRNLMKSDVPLLYWTAVAWGGAISLSKDNPGNVGEIPQMEALIDRALELDERYDHGAIHGFLINYEPSRQGASGDAKVRSQQHFERAVGLSQGRQAAPYVTFAEAISVQSQNLAEFDQLLKQALAINADAWPEFRLANLIYQRRARWLLSRRDQLFLIPDEKPKP
jgi:predicted anti-sigma-YlaC factor YlaD